MGLWVGLISEGKIRPKSHPLTPTPKTNQIPYTPEKIRYRIPRSNQIPYTTSTICFLRVHQKIDYRQTQKRFRKIDCSTVCPSIRRKERVKGWGMEGGEERRSCPPSSPLGSCSWRNRAPSTNRMPYELRWVLLTGNVGAAPVDPASFLCLVDRGRTRLSQDRWRHNNNFQVSGSSLKLPVYIWLR